MTKKIALAAALIHAPSVLILDEPFEAVDPVSAANIQDILKDSSPQAEQLSSPRMSWT